MQAVKRTKDFTIFKKRSGRYAVRASNKSWIHGDDKLKILGEAGLAVVAKKKAPPPEPAAEPAPAEEAPTGD